MPHGNGVRGHAKRPGSRAADPPEANRKAQTRCFSTAFRRSQTFRLLDHGLLASVIVGLHTAAVEATNFTNLITQAPATQFMWQSFIYYSFQTNSVGEREELGAGKNSQDVMISLPSSVSCHHRVCIQHVLRTVWWVELPTPIFLLHPTQSDWKVQLTFVLEKR